MSRILRRRPSPAMVIALVALFVALGGTSYAVTRIDRDSVRSFHIVNDAVTTADIQGGGGRTGTIKNRDTNALLAIPKGYATIQGGLAPTVLNFGGQQTSTAGNGVTVTRVGNGRYDVVFNANTGTGRFLKVDSTSDLAVLGSGSATPGGSEPVVIWDKNASSANENQVRLRIRVEDASSGNPAGLAQFSVFFYTRTVS
ncbi:MAG: hypothetical protein M3350_00250 [Actinomycetota bacterium]|nr:hypothetical protein [Actinomycetota bacterium]